VAQVGHECPFGHRFYDYQAEWIDMEQQTLRKTFKYKRKPLPQHERELERVLSLCRHIYYAAISERREA
jgi:hypothetical protein